MPENIVMEEAVKTAEVAEKVVSHVGLKKAAVVGLAMIGTGAVVYGGYRLINHFNNKTDDEEKPKKPKKVKKSEKPAEEEVNEPAESENEEAEE